MNLHALGIPLAFLIVSSLVLWFIIGSKGHWFVKAATIAGVLLFSLTLWHSTGDLAGWSSDEPLPERFLIHWMIVKEPNKSTGHPGAIYAWVSELDKDYKAKKYDGFRFSLVPAKIPGEPRTHRLEYTEMKHKQAAKITAMIRAGKMVVGENSGKGGMEAGDGEGDGKGSGKGRGKGKGKGRGKGDGKGDGGSLSQEQEFMFYELPPPKLPEKVTADY